MSCKICGTRHNASIGGYCKFHQSDRAEAAEARAEALAAELVTAKRIMSKCLEQITDDIYLIGDYDHLVRLSEELKKAIKP